MQPQAPEWQVGMSVSASQEQVEACTHSALQHDHVSEWTHCANCSVLVLRSHTRLTEVSVGCALVISHRRASADSDGYEECTRLASAGSRLAGWRVSRHLAGASGGVHALCMPICSCQWIFAMCRLHQCCNYIHQA